MSHVTCNCGLVIDTGNVPSENVYLGVSDARWVELTQLAEGADHDFSPSDVAHLLTVDLFHPRDQRYFQIYPCRMCGRLTLEGRGLTLSLVAESGDVRAWIAAMDEDLRRLGLDVSDGA